MDGWKKLEPAERKNEKSHNEEMQARRDQHTIPGIPVLIGNGRVMTTYVRHCGLVHDPHHPAGFVPASPFDCVLYDPQYQQAGLIWPALMQYQYHSFGASEFGESEPAGVTTLLIRKIPPSLSLQNLLAILDRFCATANSRMSGSSSHINPAPAFSFDFVHLLMKSKTANKSYGFVNFTSTKAASTFRHQFHGTYCWPPFLSTPEKPLPDCAEVAAANVQGLEALVANFHSSQSKRNKATISSSPIIFSPPQNGMNGQEVQRRFLKKSNENIASENSLEAKECSLLPASPSTHPVSNSASLNQPSKHRASAKPSKKKRAASSRQATHHPAASSGARLKPPPPSTFSPPSLPPVEVQPAIPDLSSLPSSDQLPSSLPESSTQPSSNLSPAAGSFTSQPNPVKLKQEALMSTARFLELLLPRPSSSSLSSRPLALSLLSLILLALSLLIVSTDF